MEKRLLWPDVLRAFSIFLVILIHTAPPLQHRSVIDLIVGFFYASALVGVPLFVMVSGAMLLGKRESYSLYFSKRIKKVFIPWLLWTIIYMLIAIFFKGKIIGSLSELKLLFYVTFFSSFWFLPMIFGLYLLTPVLRIFFWKAKINDIWYLLSVWGIFVIILPTLRLIFHLHISDVTNSDIMQFLGVYVLGYIILKKINTKKSYLWLLISLACLIFAYFEQLNFPNSASRMQGFPFNFISPEYLVAELGIFVGVFGLIGRKTINSPLEKLIARISSASIGIYLTHFIFIDFVFARVDFAFPLLRTIVIFFCSFISVVLLRKIPLIKYAVG